MVVACEGQNVLSVGRIRGPYEYDGSLTFPHKRPVDWLLHEPWRMPQQEGLRTTVWELGKSAENLLEIEQRLFKGDGGSTEPRLPNGRETARTPFTLPPLEPLAARIDSILRRKGQVVLYGPPGTGKTFRALSVAKDLAARQAFSRSFKDLSAAEQAEIVGDAGLMRVCTFHPGYGYEDFMEGLRPKTISGQMIFEPRDGIFKRICVDASKQPGRHFFLVVDEINRGDVPRIFGELITVIEHDKRGMQITLPVTGSSFTVPPNE